MVDLVEYNKYKLLIFDGPGGDRLTTRRADVVVAFVRGLSLPPFGLAPW